MVSGVNNPMVASTFCVLDPDFVNDLQATARLYDANQENADDNKWHIARIVNDMWHEHQGQFEGIKKQYYAECSRSANLGLKKKRFSDSGETLRRWCEVQETYATFPHAEDFLNDLSFEHLRVAKKLTKDGKVKAPDYALAKAYTEKWTADEMREHFDPYGIIHPYDAMKGRLEAMTNKEAWVFLKDPSKVKEVITHAKAIQQIVSDELNKEGKAT